MSKTLLFAGGECSGFSANIAMHIAFILQKLGYKVVTIDLDLEQKHLVNYLQNRQKTIANDNLSIAALAENSMIAADEKPLSHDSLADKLNQLKQSYHFIIMNNAAYNSPIAGEAHFFADEVHSIIKPNELKILGTVQETQLFPGPYSELVWQQKKLKAAKHRAALKWYVSLCQLSAKANDSRDEHLVVMAKKFGFKILPGFSEHNFQRELFLHGLTIFDLVDSNLPVQLTPEMLIAKHEYRQYFHTYNS